MHNYENKGTKPRDETDQTHYCANRGSRTRDQTNQIYCCENIGWGTKRLISPANVTNQVFPM